MASPYYFTPTAKMIHQIEHYAFNMAGIRTGHLEIGRRENVEHPDIDPSVNILLVTDRHDWNDTDLYDKFDDLSNWLADVEMTDDHKGLFDFWVYDLNGELQTQVQVWIELDSANNYQIVKLSENGRNEKQIPLV